MLIKRDARLVIDGSDAIDAIRSGSAQAGTGLERAPDDVAKQILDRVNSMNVSTSLKALVVTMAFAATAFLDPLAR